MQGYLSQYSNDPRAFLLSLQLLDDIVERPSQYISERESDPIPDHAHYSNQNQYYQDYKQEFRDYQQTHVEHSEGMQAIDMDVPEEGSIDNTTARDDVAPIYEYQHSKSYRHYNNQQCNPTVNLHTKQQKIFEEIRRNSINQNESMNVKQQKETKTLTQSQAQKIYLQKYQKKLQTQFQNSVPKKYQQNSASNSQESSFRQSEQIIYASSAGNNYTGSIKPKNLFTADESSKHNFLGQSYRKQQNRQSLNTEEQSRIYILENLDSSNVSSKQHKQQKQKDQTRIPNYYTNDNDMLITTQSKYASCNNFQTNFGAPQVTTPQSELALLKQLESQALATMNETEYAEQVKQNFQVLFQRVYGIIQEIQSRNQKNDHENDKYQPKYEQNYQQNNRSASRSHIKQFGRKQLTMNTRVVQLSVGKQNQKIKKKFCNIQTQFDYNIEAFDQDTDIKNYMKTQQCVPARTPCSSASKMMSTNLLSLSKQYPCLVSPRNNFNLNSARSDKSSKSKGITLVSVQRKPLMKNQNKSQVKKPVKITLMQKKIVLGSKKKNQSLVQSKIDHNKKTSAFNPNNFFNSRRVSGRII